MALVNGMKPTKTGAIYVSPKSPKNDAYDPSPSRDTTNPGESEHLLHALLLPTGTVCPRLKWVYLEIGMKHGDGSLIGSPVVELICPTSNNRSSWSLEYQHAPKRSNAEFGPVRTLITKQGELGRILISSIV